MSTRRDPVTSFYGGSVVFDPTGRYWQKGGKFMRSIVAELGHIVERHLGLI